MINKQIMKVCGLVITKDPDIGLLERMDAVQESVDHLIIVDNGSAGTSAETIKKYEPGVDPFGR